MRRGASPHRLDDLTGWPVYLTAMASAYCIAAIAIGESLARSTQGMWPLWFRFVSCATLPLCALYAAWRRSKSLQVLFTVPFVPFGLIMWPLVPAVALLVFALIADDDPR